MDSSYLERMITLPMTDEALAKEREFQQMFCKDPTKRDLQAPGNEERSKHLDDGKNRQVSSLLSRISVLEAETAFLRGENSLLKAKRTASQYESELEAETTKGQ